MTRQPVKSAEQTSFESRLKAPVVTGHCRACGAPVQHVTLSSQHCGGAIEVYPPLCENCTPARSQSHAGSACYVCPHEMTCMALVFSRRAVMCEWPSLAWVMEAVC